MSRRAAPARPGAGEGAPPFGQPAAAETIALHTLFELMRGIKGGARAGEKFIDALHRIGLDPFKAAANAQRTATARA